MSQRSSARMTSSRSQASQKSSSKRISTSTYAGSDIYPASEISQRTIGTRMGSFEIGEYDLPTLPKTSPKTRGSDARENSPARESDDSGGDSGISDMRRPAKIVLERHELEYQSADLISEIRTVTHLTEDFCKDVLKQQEGLQNATDAALSRRCREQCGELLKELEFKIRPYLIRLDEEIIQLERVLRTNIDQCKITEERVSWLLHYNQFMLEFRRMIQILTQSYDEVERQLRLRIRGVVASAEALSKYELIEKCLASVCGKLDVLQKQKLPA